jgi:osmotically-inducible protein OsmY
MFATVWINRDSSLQKQSLLRQVVACLLVALTLAACAGTPTRESTGEYLDDTALTTKVKAKLLDDKEVSGLAVNVETFKGVVQLSGFAKSAEQRQKTERIAESVGGVKDVRNNISLK